MSHPAIGLMYEKIEQFQKAIELIEDIAVHAESLYPEKDWKESQEAVCKIYELAHAVLAPDCLKNHPDWDKPLRKYVLRRDRK